MEIPVYGMSCAKCENTVEQALLHLPQVLEVTADRAANKVSVVLAPTKQPLNDAESSVLVEIRQVILDQGYQLEAQDSVTQLAPQKPQSPSNETTIETTSILLEIGGMSCASCVRSVEQALSEALGVSNASVNYANSSALVSMDLTSGSVEQLVKAVSDAGYSAQINQQVDAVAKRAELKQQLVSNGLRSIVALLAAVSLMLNARWGLIPESPVWWLPIGFLVLIIMALVGGRYYKGAWFAMRQGRATMDSLIALGTGAAWLFSMTAIVLPALIPLGVQGSFFEAGLFVIGFVHLGKSIEEYARGNTSVALYSLLGLQPSTALKVTSQGDELVSLESIVKGDQLCIRAGEAIPLDGVVISGQSMVNEQMLTGELAPVTKMSDDFLTGGTVNLDGTLYMRVTEVGDNTVLARMVSAVKRAQNSKPPIGQLADQISAIFVPIVMAFAVLSASIWWWFVPEVQYGFTVFMTVLIIACPCALGLAIPLSIVVGIGRAANLGIVVSHSDALQRAAELDVVVLDKTGTLTQGKPAVTSVVLVADENYAQLANVALSLEAKSLHPLALAIVAHFSDSNTSDDNRVDAKILEVDNHHSVPGSGVTGELDGKSCCVGNLQFLLANNYQEVKLNVQDNGSHVYVGYDQKILGVIVAQDKIRETSNDAIEKLYATGVEVVLLSGDRDEVVREVSQALNIREFHSELSPEAKQAFIQQRQEAGQVVAMVGDGINDALALSQADVGVAMGTGSDIAIESSDVTLMRSDLLSVHKIIVLSKKVMANIRQNLFAAFVYNIALIPVAAGVLYPFFNTLLNPGLAGFAMALSSLTVVANSARLRLMA